MKWTDNKLPEAPLDPPDEEAIERTKRRREVQQEDSWLEQAYEERTHLED